jgi:hypothetical protein
VKNCPAGTTSNGGSGLIECFKCDAGTLCLECGADKNKCKNCGDDNFLDLNSKCKAHDSTSRHPSCKTSWGLDSFNNADRCVTCNDPNKII